MSIWDDPSLASGEYVKFDNPGDKIVGTILDISIHTWEDGSRCPRLVIQEDGTDESKILTANQTMLRKQLTELRPEVGARIAIVFTSVEKRQGGKTLKHFDVGLAGGASTATVPAVAAPAPAPPPAAPVTAASLV